MIKKESRQRAWQKRNPEKVKSIKKKWNKENKGRVKQHKKNYRQLHPERIKKQSKNWRVKNKDKINSYMKIYFENAEQRLMRIIRSNTLRKYGKAKNCFFCNSKKNVEHHHIKPYHEDVFIDLCKECHEEVHRMGVENI